MMWEWNMYVFNFFKAFTKEYTCFSMISYLSGSSRSVLMKYPIGFLKSCSFFYNNMVTIMCFEANKNRMKSFVKFGLDSTGALVNATLISSNDFFSSKFHLISFILCRNCWKNHSVFDSLSTFQIHNRIHLQDKKAWGKRREEPLINNDEAGGKLRSAERNPRFEEIFQKSI